MRSKTIFALALAAAALLLLVVAGASAQATLSSKEQLGKDLFFDTNLSTPPGLACAGCHGAEVGYTGPDANINAGGAVYEGAMSGRFGNRKPPSAAYAGASATASLACVPTWHEDFRKDLSRVDVPTLVIQGDADRILPISASGLRTAKLIKGARLLVVKDGPHCITWTHADEVNRELVNFLGEGIG